MVVYTYSADDKGRFQLSKTCNEALLALVMKMLEGQLQPQNTRMYEWKGELDVSNLQKSSSSVCRYAFWSITAALPSEL